jgi:hypothetical protein
MIFGYKPQLRILHLLSSDDDEPETEEKRAVYVLNHPHIIPFLELRKNVIVTVHPNE